MAQAAGDALVALALADSVFFSLPVGEAKLRVALYLGLTMAPLAVAAPLLVPLLDRAGFRRGVTLAAAAGRAAAAALAAPRVSSLLLFPAGLALLVLSRVHALTKNGLTAAYAREELVRANARLGRIAVAGASIALVPGFAVLRIGGATPVLYFAAASYAFASLFSLSLRQPSEPPRPKARLGPGGRVPELAAAAAGTAGLRAAHGFLLFLLAFALRRADDPAYWLGVLIAAGVLGSFLGDVLATRLPRGVREETVVLLALMAAGGAALLAFATFSLVTLALFAGTAGAATRLGQVAFQGAMQARAPRGRVFVRYEVAFQLAWVAGAFLPAMLPIPFRVGVLALAAFYVAVAVAYLIPRGPLARATPRHDGAAGRARGA